MKCSALAAYIRLLRARWRWLTWGVLIALFVTTVALIVAPPVYRSGATVFIRTPGDVSSVQDGGDSYAQGRARTYAALANNTTLASSVIADLGLNLVPEVLSRRIKATNPPGTALIDIVVSSPAPNEARQTTTVLLGEYAATVAKLEAVPGSLVPRAELVVIDPPSTPVRVAAWGLPIAAVLSGAALIGLLLGAFGVVCTSIFGPLQWLSRNDDLGRDRRRRPGAGSRTIRAGPGGAVNLREFVTTLRRQWRTFTVVATAVVAVGLAWILFTPTHYVSSTQLLVTISGSTTAAAYQNDDIARDRVNSYIPLLTSEVVSQRVVDTLHVPQTAEQLAAEVSATRVPPNTSIIDVAVKADSADQARTLADAYAREFISYTTALETPTGADDHKVHVTAISSASNPRSDAAVRLALGILAVFLAILLGAAAVWIRSRAEPATATNQGATDQSDQPTS